MKRFLKNRYLLDFFAAVMFFTRIPVKWNFFSSEPPNLTRAAWCFPLIGYLIGVLSGILGDICISINLPIFLSCVIAITFSLILSGAFHEDGLADMADGFGAGGSPKKINEIMHDSRLGTYGTLALMSGFLIRLGLVITLVDIGYSLTVILSFAFATGKLSIIFIRNISNTSAFSKTGSIIEFISIKKLVVATFIWLIPIYFIFPFIGILLAISQVFLVVFVISNMSQQKLGGITGDVLGATAFVSELVFLLGLIIYFRMTF